LNNIDHHYFLLASFGYVDIGGVEKEGELEQF